jgi:hypothetical protein
VSDAYRVWDCLNEDEDDAREVLAYDAADAATEYGDILIREGDSESITTHDVFARNMATRELYRVGVSFEYVPRAVAGRPTPVQSDGLEAMELHQLKVLSDALGAEWQASADKPTTIAAIRRRREQIVRAAQRADWPIRVTALAGKDETHE